MADESHDARADYQPILRLEIEDYGCIRQTSLNLTPLHALIGPNDSGKSTVLRALKTLAQVASGSAQFLAFEPFSGPNFGIRVEYADQRGYSVRAEIGPSKGRRVWSESVTQAGGEPKKQARSPVDGSNMWAWASDKGGWGSRLTTPTMVRFEPDYLRAPAHLIPEQAGIVFADERGSGLASVFDAIVNRDVAAFLRIQEKTKELFPSVAKIGLSNSDNAHKVLAVTLVDGTRIDAQAMSEGLLYFLAFSALRYVQGSRLFLVEEPENGLHPARIADVVRVLREISKQSQVIIATHSPFVINELSGDEVTIVTRDAQGTHATSIKDTPNFEERSQVYSLGELWVSYANGRDEAPLLSGGARP